MLKFKKGNMNTQIQSAKIAKMSHLEQVESRMIAAGMDAAAIKRECSFALQIVQKSYKLQECSLSSLQAAIINIANTGLTLNPVEKLAYLVPRWNSALRCNEVTLDPSYMGLIYLSAQSGGVKSITAQLVREGDAGNIEINPADVHNPVRHRIDPFKADMGKIVGVYAVATFPDGTRQAEFMSRSEVEKVRNRSETYKAWVAGKIKSCTWQTDFGEMTRKTVVKRLVKYLPFVSQKLGHAVHATDDYAPLEEIPSPAQQIAAARPQPSPEDAKILQVKRQIMEQLKELSKEEVADRQRELKESSQTFVDNKTPKADIIEYFEKYRDDLDLTLTQMKETAAANAQNPAA